MEIWCVCVCVFTFCTFPVYWCVVGSWSDSCYCLGSEVSLSARGGVWLWPHWCWILPKLTCEEWDFLLESGIFKRSCVVKWPPFTFRNGDSVLFLLSFLPVLFLSLSMCCPFPSFSTFILLPHIFCNLHTLHPHFSVLHLCSSLSAVCSFLLSSDSSIGFLRL